MLQRQHKFFGPVDVDAYGSWVRMATATRTSPPEPQRIYLPSIQRG